MYNEERGFVMKNVIVKVLLVLLFVFLLIWLFPMPNLKPVYNRIFGENIKAMSEAAKGYFTLERLPKKVGDKVTLTLEEMLENKMILPFVDSDNKECDAKKSFVEVIRMENEYLFKTTLSCPGKTDYIIQYVGCNDVCSSCNVKEVQKKELQTQYQFYKEVKKNTVDSYSCDSGYILDGKLCIKKTSSVDKKNATIACSTGYTYNDTSKLCVKSSVDTNNATPVCSTGYVYNSSSKTCLKTIGDTANAAPVCPAGYTLSGTTCFKSTTDSYAASPECPAGHSLKGTVCSTAMSSRYDATPVCPKGYKIDGARCSVSMNTMIDADPVCNTSAGYVYNLNTDKCEKKGSVPVYSNWTCSYKMYSEKKSVYENATSTRTYVKTTYGYDGCTSACYMPYYHYEECGRTVTYVQSVVDSYTPTQFTCPMGVPSSTPRYCDVYTVSYKKPTSYNCPMGGELRGSLCYVESISTKAPTYSCASGYTLNGTTCTRTTTDTRTPTYSCTSGYTLNGTTCTRTTTDTKTPTYSCANGYTLNGTICTRTTTDTKAPTYSCTSGYTLNGTTCSKTITNVVDSKKAIVKYKDIVSKEYKWSPNKTLDGWKSTGKTRTIEIY